MAKELAETSTRQENPPSHCYLSGTSRGQTSLVKVKCYNLVDIFNHKYICLTCLTFFHNIFPNSALKSATDGPARMFLMLRRDQRDGMSLGVIRTVESVELHQTVGFEGRSTDRATAPRLTLA